MKVFVSLCSGPTSRRLMVILPKIAKTVSAIWDKKLRDFKYGELYPGSLCYGSVSHYLASKERMDVRKLAVLFLGTVKHVEILHTIIIDKRSGHILIDTLGDEGYIEEGYYHNPKFGRQSPEILHIYDAQTIWQACADFRENGKLVKPINEASTVVQDAIRNIR